jgi:hypothetical protein
LVQELLVADPLFLRRHGRSTDAQALSGYSITVMRQQPAWAGEVASVSLRVALQIVLVLGLCFPELACGRDLRDDFARPQPRRFDVGDSVLGDPTLLVVKAEDRRSVARADIVPLAVQRRWVMYLEEELEQLSVGSSIRLEGDLDRFGMGSVVLVGCVRNLASGVSDPR